MQKALILRDKTLDVTFHKNTKSQLEAIPTARNIFSFRPEKPLRIRKNTWKDVHLAGGPGDGGFKESSYGECGLVAGETPDDLHAKRQT
jgi:hypothetical protein